MDTITAVFLLGVVGTVALSGLWALRMYVGIAEFRALPLRNRIQELQEENATLKKKYAGLMGKYTQLKENFEFSEGEYSESGAPVEITPELLSSISQLSPDAILNEEFLSSIGINPSLLAIPGVKGFISKFIEGGGLQKIASKIQEGAPESAPGEQPPGSGTTPGGVTYLGE